MKFYTNLIHEYDSSHQISFQIAQVSQHDCPEGVDSTFVAVNQKSTHQICYPSEDIEI